MAGALLSSPPLSQAARRGHKNQIIGLIRKMAGSGNTDLFVFVGLAGALCLGQSSQPGQVIKQ